MSSWIQLTSINPPGPIWVNLDTGYYMNAVATGTAIHFGGASIGQPDNCRQRIASRNTRCRCGNARSSEHLGHPFGTPAQQAEHPRPLH